MGDQAKGFARTMVNNIHCSPFVCTDPPPVLEYSQVGWAQSNLSNTVLALPSHLLVLQVQEKWFRRIVSVVTWIVLTDPRSCFLQGHMVFAIQRGQLGYELQSSAPTNACDLTPAGLVENLGLSATVYATGIYSFWRTGLLASRSECYFMCVVPYLDTYFRLRFSTRTDSRVAEVLSWESNFNDILVHWGGKPCTDVLWSHRSLITLLELR